VRGADAKCNVTVRNVPKSADDEWLGTQDAAAQLGITARTLYRLIDEGSIDAYKLGRVLRIRRADVTAYLEAVKVKPGELSHLYPATRDGDGSIDSGP
jgi:excisionase family DNA binding protein